ncbi:MAG: hypothetical protein SGJ21_13620 [Alphaproteobacteria bacterium]|nr:hypothetical protein [Alphaproteobacteria bacterium]
MFEFYIVLLSFVVSLGITSLLGAGARLAQEADRVVFSWRYAIWALAIFNLEVVFWIKSWTYQDSFVLRAAHALPPLLLAIIGYLACGLATPQTPAEGPIDLKAFHDAQGRKYAIASAAFMIVAIVQGAIMGDFVLDGSSVPLDAAGPALLAVVFLVAAIFRRNRWVQIGAPLIYLVSSAAYYVELIGW